MSMDVKSLLTGNMNPQAKLMAENCSPRMKGLYQNLLKALSLAGGTTFAAFCHIGYDSRY